MSKDDEQELIKELIAGLETAQREFFNRYYNGLIRHLLYTRKARNQEDAEEIADNAFLRVFKDIRGFEGRSSLKTWLWRITGNAAIDFYRSPKNRSLTSLPPGNEQINDSVTNNSLSSEQSTPEPVTEALKKELQRKVRECIQQLNEEHRTVITLRMIDGYSVKETAQLMKKTEGAVKMLFLRAWRKLTKIVKEDPYFIDYQVRNKKEVTFNEK